MRLLLGFSFQRISIYNLSPEVFAPNVGLDGGHSVGGEGAGLVGADCGSVTHRLASVQVTHQILVFQHFLDKNIINASVNQLTK